MKYDDRYTRLFGIDILDGAMRSGKYGFSTIHATRARPERLISFDKAVSCRDRSQWVHCYIPDPLFSRLAQNPWRYLPMYQGYDGAITPDFSVGIRMPLYRQIQSVGDGRAIGSWLQRCGVDVIPNVRWGLRETYEFCFDGVEPGGTVSVGTLGCTRDKELREVFREGVPEMLRRVEPTCVIVYGPLREDVFAPVYEASVEVLHFDSRTTIVHKAV